MVNKDEFLTTPMGSALLELSQRMQEQNYPPVSLNVVGGFALMMRGHRPADMSTDIDYVGQSLPASFDRMADEIGLKHNLGRKWINNDVIMSGMSLENFEFSSGKLHFDPVFSVGNIQINALQEKDLLRMKIIAIDTSLTAVESNGDFTRLKDMPDITTLMQATNMSLNDIRDEFSDYIINTNTIDIIRCYQNDGEQAVKDAVSLIAERNLAQQRKQKSYIRSPFIQNLLQQLEEMEKDDGEDQF